MIVLQIKDKEDLYEKLKYILFEFYKQGFLFSNFITESLVCEPTQLKNGIIDDFKWFFEQNGEKMISNLEDKAGNSPKKRLRLADLIVDDYETNPPQTPKLDEIVVKCPACNKKIYPTDINLDKINTAEITNFPFPYLHIHSYDDCIPHALLMYIDRDLKVRGRKVIKFLNLS